MIPEHIWRESTQFNSWLVEPRELVRQRSLTRTKALFYRKKNDEIVQEDPRLACCKMGVPPITDPRSTGITPFVTSMRLGAPNSPDPVRSSGGSLDTPIIREIGETISKRIVSMETPLFTEQLMSSSSSATMFIPPPEKKAPLQMIPEKAHNDNTNNNEGKKMPTNTESLAVVSGFTRKMLNLVKKDLQSEKPKLFLPSSYPNSGMTVVYTAAMYARRYYLFEPVVAQPPHLIFITALILAAKAEETIVDEKNIALSMGCPDTKFLKQTELDLLEKLRFHITVYHPYSNPTPGGLGMYMVIVKFKDVLMSGNTLHLQKAIENAGGVEMRDLVQYASMDATGKPRIVRGKELTLFDWFILCVERYTAFYVEQTICTDILFLLSPRAVLCICVAEAFISSLYDLCANRLKIAVKNVDQSQIQITRHDVYLETLKAFDVTEDPDNLISHLKYLAFANILVEEGNNEGDDREMDNSSDEHVDDLNNIPGYIPQKVVEAFSLKFSPSSSSRLILSKIQKREQLMYEHALKRCNELMIPLKVAGTAVNRVIHRAYEKYEYEAKRALRNQRKV